MTDKISPAVVAELEALLAEATQGEWCETLGGYIAIADPLTNDGIGKHIATFPADGPKLMGFAVNTNANWGKDAALIVALRNHADSLIDAAKEAEATVADLNRAISVLLIQLNEIRDAHEDPDSDGCVWFSPEELLANLPAAVRQHIEVEKAKDEALAEIRAHHRPNETESHCVGCGDCWPCVNHQAIAKLDAVKGGA